MARLPSCFAFSQPLSFRFIRFQPPYRPQCPRSPGKISACSETIDPIASSSPVKWKCMSNCGACCRLGDFDEEVLRGMLRSETDVVEYLGMVGSDGWCIHFDTFTRKCGKYEDRPRFCRATPQVFEDLYGVEKEDFDEYAISCCEYHIGNVFGEESQEAQRYEGFKKSPSSQPQLYEVDMG